MRSLPPLKAIAHALRSVVTYRMVGVRIGALWITILFLLDAVELLFLGDGATENGAGGPAVARFLTATVGLFGFCSIAVGWHRFILRDEIPTLANSLRLDALVLRYVGNSLLALLAGVVPLVVLATIVAFLPRAAITILLPAALAAGALISILSVKLPAIALGRTDFSFRDALKSADGNFWQVSAVFLLNGLIIFLPALALTEIVLLLRQTSPAVAVAAGLILSVPLNLFFTLFSISVLTSLYGFFVERRDF